MEFVKRRSTQSASSTDETFTASGRMLASCSISNKVKTWWQAVKAPRPAKWKPHSPNFVLGSDIIGSKTAPISHPSESRRMSWPGRVMVTHPSTNWAWGNFAD